MDRHLPPAVAVLRIVRLEQQRAQRGRERQRDGARHDRGARDGERELPVELPGDAGDEGGRNEHRAQHQRDRDQRGADLVHAADRGLARDKPAAMLRSTFSTTTIASSTTMPTASTSPNSVRLFSVKPNIAMKKNVPISDTGMATIGMTAARQVCRKMMIDQHDEQHRFENGLDHGVDRLADELGRIVDDGVLDAGRKALRDPLHRLHDRIGGRERVRAGPLEDRERDRRAAAEIGVRRIVLRGELDRRDVLQPHHRAGGLLHHDVGELLRIGEPPERLHRDLERARLLDRRLVEHAGGDLDVLRLQRLRHVVRRHAERLQPARIEPDAHRVVAAAEHRDRADAVDAQQADP